MNVETVNALKQAAWGFAKEDLAALELQVRKGQTPALAAAVVEVQEVELRERYEDALVPYLINHMLRAEVAMAAAVTQGILPEQAVAALQVGLRGYCIAAAQDRGAFCKPPCDWRGKVADVGPVGVCPTCGAAPVKMLDLLMPTHRGNGIAP